MFDPDQLQPMNLEGVDDYEDDDDPGFDTYVVNEENFVQSCEELAKQFGFPQRAIAKDTEENKAFRDKKRAQMHKENGAAIAAAKKKGQSIQKEDSAVLLKTPGSGKKPAQEKEEATEEDDGRAVSVLPKWIKFMPSNDEFYPAEFD